MSEPYQIFALMPQGLPAAKAVFRTHEVFAELGGSLDEDSLLILNDTPDEEPEPEEIGDPAAALERLATWPTLGSIVYAMPEGMTTVTFQTKSDTCLVQSVSVSILEKAFEGGGQQSKARYLTLARKLHDKLHAKRTILEWGLEYGGFRWREEIERLKEGAFAGTFDLFDLKTLEG